MYGILPLILLFTSCSEYPSKNYSVSVEYLPVGVVEQELAEQGRKVSHEFSSATVTIKQVYESESNKDTVAELMVASLHEGRVEFHGQSETSIWLEVVVESDVVSNPLITRAFVEPGETVSLAVVDKNWTNAIAHVGTLTNVQDPAKKFTLSADLSRSNDDLVNALVTFEKTAWSEKSERRSELIDHVVVVDGEFNIEVEIEDPVVAFVYVDGEQSHAWAELIAEPGGSILLHPSRRTAHASANLTTGWFQESQEESQRVLGQELVAVSGSGRHAKLLESWKSSYTYQLKQQQLIEADDDHFARNEEWLAMSSSLKDGSNLEEEKDSSKPEGSNRVNNRLYKGCEHVDLSQVLPDRRAQVRIAQNESRSHKLWNEQNSIRLSSLNDIARNAEDPFDILLALELRAHDSPQESYEALKMYEKLSETVSPDVAETRVEPARRFFSAVMESERNEHRTVPGQKAPNFVLSNLEGTPLEFHQILKKSDLVYMEFLRYPDHYSRFQQRLRSLHESYRDAGLQIVAVLFDVDSELRMELDVPQDITWIQMYDSDTYIVSEVARTFALVHRGMNYLIDTKGCIIQRDLWLPDLQEFLNSYFPASSVNE